MTNALQKQFDERVRRLLEQREYVRTGWRVPIRTVKVPTRTMRAFLKEWLCHPLIAFDKAT